MEINLLVLCRDYPVISAGMKRVHHLIQDLPHSGVKVQVLSPRGAEIINNEVGVYNGINYARIGSGLTVRISHFFLLIHYYFGVMKFIIHNKDSKRKNILYSYSSINIENLAFIFLARLVGYKIVLDIVEDFSLYESSVQLSSKFKFWTSGKFNMLNIKLSDAIIVISGFLQNKYQKLGAKNLILIPITTVITTKKIEKEAFNSPLRVVYAGSYDDKDGVGLIILSFIEFLLEEPDAILFLLGSGKNQKIYKKKYGDIDNIEFTGFLPDEEYYDFLENSDVLCMCRTNSGFANAGFPFKLGEYLATGNPVISTVVSDINLYLSHESAFLITPDSQIELIGALRKINNNPKNALRIGKNGLNVCRQYFERSKNGKKLEEILKLL